MIFFIWAIMININKADVLDRGGNNMIVMENLCTFPIIVLIQWCTVNSLLPPLWKSTIQYGCNNHERLVLMCTVMKFHSWRFQIWTTFFNFDKQRAFLWSEITLDEAVQAYKMSGSSEKEQWAQTLVQTCESLILWV